MKNKTMKKFLRAVKSAIDDLKGSYAIEVISPLYPDRIIVVRKDSPLVIGKGEKKKKIILHQIFLLYLLIQKIFIC